MTEMTVPANILKSTTVGSLPSRDQVNTCEWGRDTGFRGGGREITVGIEWVSSLNENLE